jgi:hypothetical protein
MSNDSDKYSAYKPGEVGLLVACLWESVENPMLVASIRVQYALTKAREEVDVVITSEGATIRHRTFKSLFTAQEERIVRSTETPEGLSSKLRTLGIFDLGSSGQRMYDGALAEIAAKELDRENSFWERSIDTPQAEIRKLLLGLAHEAELEAEQDRAGQTPNRSESEMSFIVTKPNII